ncbi:MAG: hypothetical protein P8Z36_03415 [Gemmatimonadota bacterium]
MAENETSREEELRNLLTDAIEVQLAALKAGISFWSEWIEQTSGFVHSATDSLSAINAGDEKTEDALLGLLDAGRESARTMTEIPRHTAQRFLDELDAASAKRVSAAKSGAKKSGGGSKTKSAGATRRKRAGRAKA